MADPASRSGARYADTRLLEWVAGVHAAHDDALARAFGASESGGLPAIQVGPSEGRLLELLVRMTGAEKVVEVGTLAGYSALWLARAMPETGRLWTLEADPRHAAVARANVEAASLTGRVEICEGDALTVLDAIAGEGPFDVVFVDADKGNYDRYGRWAARHLRTGGLLIGDNAFYFGNLLAQDEPAAAAMRRFHEDAAQNFHSTCIPTPDGLLLGIKRADTPEVA